MNIAVITEGMLPELFVCYPTSFAMTAHATAEATRRYAQKFAASAAPGHFRSPAGSPPTEQAAPLFSSVGIGTYLGQPDTATDEAYTQAVVAAVEGGINFLDSAINYRFQRSERSIGAALAELDRRGFPREEVVVCTKGGYLTPDGEMPSDPRAYFEREYFRPGVLQAADVAAGCHAMSASFLADQLDRSRANLGVDCVDVYYVHNPETQLSEVPREEFDRRLRVAFKALEAAADAGKIRYYGVATWDGFRVPSDAPSFLSLAAIEQIAREVAGGAHRLRFVQLPYNLAMTEALTRANQPVHGPAATMVEAAQALDITLVASASLLQGKVAARLPAFIGDALGLDSDAERAIQFARSSPGITTALVGMSQVAHVQANLRLVGQPPATSAQFARLFTRGQQSG